MKIAFDVDGTLIINDTPRYEVLQMMFLFKLFGNEIIVWSGGGVDYAKRWCEKLGIDHMVTVLGKGFEPVDIAIDDEVVELGKVNLRV